MKWRELRSALARKTDSKEEEAGSRHDRIWVTVDGLIVGPILMSRGSDEMRGREIGNCARSLGLKEGAFRHFVDCTMGRDEFAAAVARQG
jgi:hypothetical protein